jgi:hypothetical protein
MGASPAGLANCVSQPPDLKGDTKVNESQSYRLKLVADDAFIEQLKTYAAESSSGIAIQTEAKEHDATKLGFDIGSVITVVSVVSAAVNIIKFSGSVTEWLGKSKANKVVLQTPFRHARAA